MTKENKPFMQWKRQEEEEVVITTAAGAIGFVPQITTLWVEIDTWAVGIFWQLIIAKQPLVQFH